MKNLTDFLKKKIKRELDYQQSSHNIKAPVKQ